MKIGAFEILLFFICLNLGCYILNEMEALPITIQSTETPLSIRNVVASVGIITVGVVVGFLIGAIWQGAVIAIIIASLSLVLPMANWVFFGVVDLFDAIGVPTVISTVIQILVGTVWVWFLIGLIAQRYME